MSARRGVFRIEDQRCFCGVNRSLIVAQLRQAQSDAVLRGGGVGRMHRIAGELLKTVQAQLRLAQIKREKTAKHEHVRIEWQPPQEGRDRLPRDVSVAGSHVLCESEEGLRGRGFRLQCLRLRQPVRLLCEIVGEVFAQTQ